jgi:hypothetical protein
MKSRLLLFSLVSALPLSAADFQWDVNAAGLGGEGTWNTANAFWDANASRTNYGTDAPFSAINPTLS